MTPSYLWTCDGFPVFSNCARHVYSNVQKEKDIFLLIIDSLNSDKIDLLSQNKAKIILTNNHVTVPLAESLRIVTFEDSWYGMYAGTPYIVLRAPTKSFNCFINRMDPVRQSWAYQLIRRNLFDHGYISFNMDISRHRQLKMCAPTDTPMDVFEKQFKESCAIFDQEHKILKPIVPYKNFDSDCLSQVTVDSKFSIVLETYHHDNRFITLSEKIFRCLKLPRPWVMHAQQGAVAYLKKLGFDTLDDIVDHSYDAIDFTIDRQTAILDQCEKLMQIDIDQHQTRLTQSADHNIALLNKFYQQWYEDVDSVLALAKQKIKEC